MFILEWFVLDAYFCFLANVLGYLYFGFACHFFVCSVCSQPKELVDIIKREMCGRRFAFSAAAADDPNLN